MKTKRFPVAAWVVAAVVAFSRAPAAAQDEGDDELPPPPPVVQRMLEVAKDPEKLRALMSDPERVVAVMEAMDNDEVREFMSDPRRVADVMRQVDIFKIREIVQSVDRNKIREAMLARWRVRLKEQLGAGDDEWKVLEPRILKVARARRDARVEPRGVGGGRARTGVVPIERGDPTDVDEAETALREASSDPEVHANDVARSLATYRRALDGARKRLDQAEAELKELLTHRQEGVLMVVGLLR